MIYSSPYPDIELPEAALHEFVLRGSPGGDSAGGDSPDGDSPRPDPPSRAERAALVDATTGETITYGRLGDLVEQVAAGFAAAGLGRGGLLAICAPNTVLYPVACLAASRVGATVVPINALSTPGELVAQLAAANASHLVTTAAQLPALSRVELPGTVREVFVLDRADAAVPSLLQLAPEGARAPDVEVDVDRDIAVLAHSSGTTGTAKGVMLTHRNVTANIAQMARALEVNAGHRVVAVLPFSHVYGFSTLIGLALHGGSTVVVMPRFDLAQFLDTIARYRITHALIAPPIATALAKHPAVSGYDLSSLHQILSSAAPLRSEIAELVRRRLGIPVVQAYGMTELSPCALVPSPDGTPVGSVGRPLPNTECRLVSTVDGMDVGPGEAGELWVRGPQVMRGYRGQPDATDAIVDVDGWLHTGDVASVDEDGWFFLRDRVKELIKYKGYQVAPAELEGVLLTHPLIADAAVIGVTDDSGEEVPKAFVVRAPAAPDQPELTATDVINYVAAVVAPYKKVRSVEFLDALPRSPAGKILRRQLREARAPGLVGTP
jgi:acyl-CoA synthetase (AMP-forming)/AMP-acid ligase II